MAYQQSVSHWCVSHFEAAQWKELQQIGIRGIDLAPPQKLDELRELGFQIASMGGHGTLEDGLNKPANHNRIADELRAALELAKSVGCPNLVVFSGNRNGLSEPEGAQNTAAGLDLVKKDAENAGVNLVIELLNSKVDHRDYQCDHTSWGVEVCKMVASPRVKLLYDIYHMQIMEGDLIRTIRDNIEWIAHFHTAGNPGRFDLDEEQEIFYPAVGRAIKATGYTGWIGHEFRAKGDPIAALRQAFEQLNV